MQEESSRRSNAQRTEATRAALIAAARRLFVENGYAQTGTPELVAAAGLTRGALYHHFEDKRALFQAVVEAESAVVAAEIERAAPVELPPLAALVTGGEAFLDAMLVPGRTRLLLIDGPAVLGRAEMDRIDAEIGGTRSLREGLAIAMRANLLARLPLDALTAQLSAAYDRAALAVAAGHPRKEQSEALAAIVGGLSAS